MANNTKIVKFPNKKFVVDRSNPERTMSYYHSCLEAELNNLDRRMEGICDKYDLAHKSAELFVDYNPFQLGEIVIPIQTMFTRCDFLLRLFECQLKWLANELDLANMSKEIKDAHRLLYLRLQTLRNIYVNGVGAEIMEAFRRCLLLTAQGENIEEVGEDFAMPDSIPMPADYKFNEILVRYFGDVMDYPTDFDSTVFKEMEEFLDRVGEFTKMKTEVNKIKRTIRAKLKKA